MINPKLPAVINFYPESKLVTDSTIFLSEVSSCNYNHLKYCDCQKPIVNHFVEQAIQVDMDKIKEVYVKNGWEFNENNPDVILRRAEGKDRGIQIAAAYLKEKNVKCIKELQGVNEVLTRFAGKYDLKNPEVYNIIEALINMKLNILRMKTITNNEGIKETKYDKEGNSYEVTTDLLKYELDYNKALIDGIVKLNNMVEGIKSIVGVVDMTDNIKSVWEHRKLIINKSIVIEADEYEEESNI